MGSSVAIEEQRIVQAAVSRQGALLVLVTDRIVQRADLVVLGVHNHQPVFIVALSR